MNRGKKNTVRQHGVSAGLENGACIATIILSLVEIARFIIENLIGR